MKRLFLIAVTLLSLGTSLPARAQDASERSYMPKVDLVLPPVLETPDAPFYRGAKVKVDSDMIPIVEGELPPGQVAGYAPESHAVIVSNSNTISEADKGQALLDVVSAMQVGDIATAAGQESPQAPKK